jgi:hypothetical protein
MCTCDLLVIAYMNILIITNIVLKTLKTVCKVVYSKVGPVLLEASSMPFALLT